MQNTVSKVKTVRQVNFSTFSLPVGTLLELVDDFEREIAVSNLSGRARGATPGKRARVADYEAVRVEGAVRFVNRDSLETSKDGSVVLYVHVRGLEVARVG